MPLADGLGEGRHGEVGHGAALELNVDHLGVADVVVAVVDTPDLQYRVLVRDIQHSHAVLSLVESCRRLKYFHELKGPIIDSLSDVTPVVLCHKEPACCILLRWFLMA